MRLLIIGASGFLGSHIRRRALAAGLAVTTAGRSALEGSPGHQLVDLGSDSSERIAGVLEASGADVVVNCAGAITGSLEHLAQANITTTSALTRAMLEWRLPARLVHLGSAAEYGWSEPGVPVAESEPARPVGVYGVTKLAGTRLVELARAGGVDAVVLRVFNPIGLGAPEESLPGRLVSQVRSALTGAGDVRVGPLDSVRDFVDARDVADAVVAAATRPTLPHAVVNVGSGLGVSGRLLLKELYSVSGCTSAVHEDSAGSARSSAVAWQEADIARAARDLGWRPCRDLTTSLADWWREVA
jgi:NDP-hexose 4-ketoreductase